MTPSRTMRYYRKGRLGSSRLSPLAAVAAEFGVSISDIVGPSRKPMHVTPRQLAAWVYATLGESQTAIGVRLGGRDHSTIAHSLRVADELLKSKLVRERMRRVLSLCGIQSLTKPV